MKGAMSPVPCARMNRFSYWCKFPMDSGIGRAGFHIAFYIVFVAGILLLFLERGSAEFAITLFSFILGLLFLSLIVIWVRYTQRKP